MRPQPNESGLPQPGLSQTGLPQPDPLPDLLPASLVPRVALATLQRTARGFSVPAVTGSRQSGKTTNGALRAAREDCTDGLGPVRRWRQAVGVEAGDPLRVCGCDDSHQRADHAVPSWCDLAQHASWSGLE